MTAIFPAGNNPNRDDFTHIAQSHDEEALSLASDWLEDCPKENFLNNRGEIILSPDIFEMMYEGLNNYTHPQEVIYVQMGICDFFNGPMSSPRIQSILDRIKRGDNYGPFEFIPREVDDIYLTLKSGGAIFNKDTKPYKLQFNKSLFTSLAMALNRDFQLTQNWEKALTKFLGEYIPNQIKQDELIVPNIIGQMATLFTEPHKIMVSSADASCIDKYFFSSGIDHLATYRKPPLDHDGLRKKAI